MTVPEPLARNGWVDVAFASAFLLTMGLCIWPGWFAWWPRPVLMVAAVACTAGDARWPVRLKPLVWIASIGLWVGGLRYWYVLGQTAAPSDTIAFATVLVLAAAVSLWRPLPRDAALT